MGGTPAARLCICFVHIWQDVAVWIRRLYVLKTKMWVLQKDDSTH